MRGMAAQGTRGILNPHRAFRHFSLEREPGPPDLAAFVENFWSVRWELEAGQSFAQEVLPYPCANLSLEDGRFLLHGPCTQRFAAHLAGEGVVSAVKFTPAGFFAFAALPMRQLVDAIVPVEAATGRPLPAPAATDFAAVRAALEAFLRSVAPKASESLLLVNRLVHLAQEDRQIARAEDLASLAETSLRSLHRLFERHVGVGPKWIVRRARVQEAAERVANGERVDWARTAQELGYFDQAHLIRDFRDQVGFTPEAYARRCAAAAADASPARVP